MSRDAATLPAALGLEVVGMTKRFGALTALDDVSLKIRAGSFHALLGENGAGKSTLVKCIMGYYRADEGQVIVGVHEQTIASPREAHALGIGMVYQHFTLVPNMTVAENLVLVRDHIPTIIDWRREREALAAFLGRMPFTVPLDARAGDLAAGEKQKVEILKQLYLERRLLILDEPTSVLTPGEADEILGLLHDLTRAGRLTVLMITHKFREVTRFAEAVTVLRRGRVAGAGTVAELGVDRMTRLMVGNSPPPAVAVRHGVAGAPVLEVQGLRVDNDAGHPAVRGADFTVHAGEIVGIAGVSGNGQRELVEALAGQRPPTGGTIRIHGEAYHATRTDMRRHKIFCLTEEPLRSACVPSMTLAENMALRDFDEPPFASGGWWLNPAAVRRSARELIARFRIKASGPDAPITSLSGGNVQRAVLARELRGDVAVLVAANPCFGLDFAAVADIHARILDVRSRGAAILLISEDLDELFELADRIAVMFNGKLVYECPAGQADAGIIGRHMAGWRGDVEEAHAAD